MGNHIFTFSLLLVIVCVCVSVMATNPKPQGSPSDSACPIDIHGVKIWRHVSDTKLSELGVASWPTWEGTPSTFPWTFNQTETMYLLEGKVKVTVDGYNNEEDAFVIGKGNLVIFPKGMKVVWVILEAVKKHYSLTD